MLLKGRLFLTLSWFLRVPIPHHLDSQVDRVKCHHLHLEFLRQERLELVRQGCHLHPVAVAFPSLPRSLPVPETSHRLLCLECHYRLAARVSLRRPLVASRTSRFPLLVRRDSLPFRLQVPGSLRVPVLARQSLRDMMALVGHRRCLHLRARLRELLCQVLRVLLLRVLVTGGDRKSDLGLIYGCFQCFISYT